MTGLSNPTFRCSAVIPEGPPAHPFLAVLKLCKNLSTSRSNGTSGSKSAIAGSNSDLGLLGLRASSVRILLVAYRGRPEKTPTYAVLMTTPQPGSNGKPSQFCIRVVFAATPLPCSRRDPTHRVLM